MKKELIFSFGGGKGKGRHTDFTTGEICRRRKKPCLDKGSPWGKLYLVEEKSCKEKKEGYREGEREPEVQPREAGPRPGRHRLCLSKEREMKYSGEGNWPPPSPQRAGKTASCRIKKNILGKALKRVI